LAHFAAEAVEHFAYPACRMAAETSRLDGRAVSATTSASSELAGLLLADDKRPCAWIPNMTAFLRE
jgi:hypothetical protein